MRKWRIVESLRLFRLAFSLTHSRSLCMKAGDVMQLAHNRKLLLRTVKHFFRREART